jgi:ABC-type amino acid transport substrate-binding protein
VSFDFPAEVIATDFYIFYDVGLQAFKDLSTVEPGLPIGVVRDDYPEDIIRRNYPLLNVKPYDDHDALITGALRGEIRAFVLEPEVANYYLFIKGAIGSKFRQLSAPFLHEPLSAGLGKSKYEFGRVNHSRIRSNYQRGAE